MEFNVINTRYTLISTFNLDYYIVLNYGFVYLESEKTCSPIDSITQVSGISLLSFVIYNSSFMRRVMISLRLRSTPHWKCYWLMLYTVLDKRHVPTKTEMADDCSMNMHTHWSTAVPAQVYAMYCRVRASFNPSGEFIKMLIVIWMDSLCFRIEIVRIFRKFYMQRHTNLKRFVPSFDWDDDPSKHKLKSKQSN